MGREPGTTGVYGLVLAPTIHHINPGIQKSRVVFNSRLYILKKVKIQYEVFRFEKYKENNVCNSGR